MSKKYFFCMPYGYIAFALAGFVTTSYAQNEETFREQSLGIELQQQEFIFNGFATVGLANISDSNIGVVRSYSQEAPFFSGDTTSIDTAFGLQTEWRMNADNHFTTLLVFRPVEDKTPNIRLGYWETRLWAPFKLRIGRIGNPTFRDSDATDIGYAHTMVRPPLPIYTKLNAISQFDGFDLGWLSSSDDVTWMFHIFNASSNYTQHNHIGDSLALKTSIENFTGLVAMAQTGNVNVRYSISRIDKVKYSSAEIEAMNSDIQKLGSAMRLSGSPVLAAQADSLDSYQNVLNFSPMYSSISAEWTGASWKVLAEYTSLNAYKTFIGDSHAWAVQVVKTTGPFSFYGFLSQQTTDGESAPSSAFNSTGLPVLDRPINDLHYNLSRLRGGTDLSMRSNGVGVRYDFSNYSAFKLQLEELSWNNPLMRIGNIERYPVWFLSSTVEFVF